MDFAKMMSAQIAKSSKPIGGSAQFQRRADVEAAREAAYRAEQAAQEQEKLAREDKKRKLVVEEAERKRETEAKRRRLAAEAQRQQQEADDKAERERRKRLGLPEVPTKPDEAEEDEEEDGAALKLEEANLTEAQLLQKLRDLGEPTRVFGESHKKRLKRYLKTIDAGADKLALAASADEAIPTTLEAVPESDVLTAAKVPPASDVDGRLLLARKMSTWFNIVLREWGAALEQRDAGTKETFAGQRATGSHAQAIEHLTPLFRKLERLSKEASTLPDELLKPMCDIVRKAQLRQYVSANDEYLQLSIGKAAWPIGVTMVGIHARSAREKLHESDKDKAHIMSDEVTRKILQSIKRCLSFAQTKWPPDSVDQMMG